MKRLVTALLMIIAVFSITQGQFVRDTTLLLPKSDMQWWRDAKFGLFIHFGLYAIEGRGEWVMWDEQIDTSEYGRLRERFTCERLDAAQWVKAAQDAGCRYMVVTARHHDGFCLFDTKFGTYDARHSAAQRDIIGEYVTAAHEPACGQASIIRHSTGGIRDSSSRVSTARTRRR